MTPGLEEPQLAEAWRIAATIPDPEVPVVTIEDLGILRDIQLVDNTVTATLTPTYSGCPAMDQIADDVRTALITAGYTSVDIRFALSPAWSTDWMTEAGKRKLEEFGIAPPNGHSSEIRGVLPIQLSVKCPRCHSLRTREVSRFGSTACKAQHECMECSEPFDFFKVH